MDLWIKSQDREQLLKVDNILAIPRMETSGEWLIMFHNSVLGAYLTKKRALEVLDEIQNKIKENNGDSFEDLILDDTPIVNCNNNDDCTINTIINNFNTTIIYEMPKE